MANKTYAVGQFGDVRRLDNFTEPTATSLSGSV